MSSARKIIIVTDSYIVASGIESLSLEVSGLLVDSVFPGSEKKLCEKIRARKPDFIMIDPASNGLDLIKVLNEMHNEPYAKIIGLVTNQTKQNIRSHFTDSLNITGTKINLIESLKNIVGKSNADFANDGVLSKREIEILRELAFGHTNQEIADNLFLSVHTVNTHRKTITKKLGIKTVSGLTVYALINNIIDIREAERRF